MEKFVFIFGYTLIYCIFGGQFIMRKIIKVFKFLFLLFILVLSGCGGNSKIGKNDDDFRNIDSPDELSDFYFETILVYCPLNLEKPVMEIKNIFEEKTGCEVQINAAPFKDLKEQLKTSKMGEVFISESKDGMKNIFFFIDKKKEIAGHKPVLAVKKNNFSGIDSLDGLMENDVFLSFCSFDSGIGGVSKKFFELCSEKYEFNYADNIKEETAYIALEEYNNCAAVVWKETCDTEKFDVIEISELDELYEPINAVRLKYSEDDAAANEFISFLDSKAAKEIFLKYGYDIQ